MIFFFIISRNRSKPLSFPEAQGTQIYFLLITYIRFSGLWILKKATDCGKQLSSSSAPYIRPCGPLTTSPCRERTEDPQYCSEKGRRKKGRRKNEEKERGEEQGSLPETGEDSKSFERSPWDLLDIGTVLSQSSFSMSSEEQEYDHFQLCAKSKGVECFVPRQGYLRRRKKDYLWTQTCPGQRFAKADTQLMLR